MRQFRERFTYSDSLKDAPLGVCDVCGGEGRYRVTHRHRQPVIHKCIYCRGTGKVKVKLERIEGRRYGDVEMHYISETETYYTAATIGRELVQLSKEEYEIAKR